ncbi:deferrochelatase/peroxidase EfeB [Streptomyces triticagri]|uniref:Deferrochelatase n=1 Tax=Streptomyces triticagri TaxID=2293568 RepID=A0A372LX14_9ACTN|nr:iron uptake transporter deferrochelatase/peroxidase subunit [Streptomyces triticagri]RFU83204.1 deferrochelatase/peroxidase EfeB [Streptomyces triticagri]
MAGSPRNPDSAPKAAADAAPSGSGSGASAPDEGPARGGTISRRRLIGTAGATGVVLGAAGLGAGYAVAGARDSDGSDGAPLTSLGADSVSFEGARQPGIITPAQAHCHLVAFDLAASADRRAAAALLRRWSATARRLMAGAGTDDSTGIALDAGPSSLTVTFGFGHSFFARTGLEGQRPGALDPLPDFSSDHLDPKRSNGDLWVQIGADDALVAFDALRTLQRDAGGTARVRWQMNGFNRSPGATARPMTTRNLMGQVDGTNNPQESDEDFRERLFATGGGTRRPAWMSGGSYAVVRRIRMLLDDWDGLSRPEQERVIGRRKKDGAPLSGGSETTEPKLDAVGKDGKLLIAPDAHARISRPDQNGGAAMLRRPFSFHDGYDADGVPDAGLLFIAWQADPHRGFVPVQRKLDRGDALSKFIRHESSAVFAVPRGARKGEYVGQELLEG